MSDTVRYPEIEVELTGRDGNPAGIIGATMKALRRGGVSAEEVSVYVAEASSGDYDNVLATTMRWVETS